MKKGFTLVELLVVIGIIAILVGLSLTGFSKMMKTADNTKAQELLSNTATALAAIYESDGMWPKKLREAGGSGEGRLDQDVALVVAKRGMMSLSMNADRTKLVGRDRFGIVTPYAEAIIKSMGTGATLGTHVTGSTTIEDHILRFAVDLDGDGIVENANGTKVRATAAVWCLNKEGKILTSWTVGQTKGID